ncbi:MAG: hypothetical protein ABJE47_04750 [bacterium]
MHRSLRKLGLLTLLLAACRNGKPADEAPAPIEPPTRPLAQLAAQRVILVPTFSLGTGDVMGWSTQIPKSRDYLKTVDDELETALGERGLKKQWIYPADLQRALRNNPTYAMDPYSLGTNVLRNPNIVSGTKLGDPLATQIRTMVALQEDARAVLVPVELKFEQQSPGLGVAVLRLVLLDGRLGDVRWVGTVKSDPAKTLSRPVLASLATHFADLITAP